MTRSLSPLDLMVVALYRVMISIAGMWLTRRAGQPADEFFVGGRHMPW